MIPELNAPNLTNFVLTCQKWARKIAGSSEKLPSSLLLIGEVMMDPNFREAGGFADLYMGHYLGRPVSIRAPRIYNSDFTPQMRDQIIKVYRDPFLLEPILTMLAPRIYARTFSKQGNAVISEFLEWLG